jgi:hypothetical protein
VLILLGANLVLLAVFTGPRLAQERYSAERLASLRERVAEQRGRTEALRARAEVVRANTEQLARFYDDVVCADEAARFALVESLERDLSAVGVRADRRSWNREDVPGLPLERVMGTLPTRGSYAQLTELLGRLERSPEFLIVEQVRLRSQRNEPASLDVAVATYCRMHEAGP